MAIQSVKKNGHSDKLKTGSGLQNINVLSYLWLKTACFKASPQFGMTVYEEKEDQLSILTQQNN